MAVSTTSGPRARSWRAPSSAKAIWPGSHDDRTSSDASQDRRPRPMFDPSPQAHHHRRGPPPGRDLQRLPLLRGLLRRFPLGLLAARLQRRGHHPAGQPLPQLPRLLLCLPVYRPARVRPEPARALAEVRVEKLGPLSDGGRLRPPLPTLGAARWRFMLVLGIAALFWALTALAPASGEGFYATSPIPPWSRSSRPPSFCRWRPSPSASNATGPRSAVPASAWPHLKSAFADAATDAQPVGRGPPRGAISKQGDRYSQARRHAHQAVFWGFLLCFASTSSGHGPALCLRHAGPYGLFSLPKLRACPAGSS